MRKSILLLVTLLVLALPAGARKVTGKVISGEQRLSGVIVTDGENFTLTDRKGAFRLKVADDAPFIYIVSPAGYQPDCSRGAPAFYQRLTRQKAYTFTLTATRPGTDYALFSVSDPQMQNEKHLKRFRGAPLEDLKARVAEYGARMNTVGVALGDVAWNLLDMFGPYKESISETGIPFYTVMGNHDFIQNVSGKAAQASYEEAFGPVNWAFWLGEDLVIGLNNLIFKGSVDDPTKSGKYVEGYPQWTMDLVKGLLPFIPKGTHLYIAQHSPLYRWFQDKKIVGGEEMLALLEGYEVDILSGHTHIRNIHHYSDAIVEYNAASVCGSWWMTDYCNDGTPRGYDIFTCTDGKHARFWHNIDFPDDHLVEFSAVGESTLFPEAVVANVWDFDRGWKLEWFLDGVSQGVPEQVKDLSPNYIREINEAYRDKEIPRFKRPRLNTHYFATGSVPEGAVVRFVVTAPDGRTWQYETPSDE